MTTFTISKGVRQPKFFVVSNGDGSYQVQGPGSNITVWGEENAETARRAAEQNHDNGKLVKEA